MGTKEDFAELFSGLENELELLPIRFELKDFNYMMTAQRTMNRIHGKLRMIINDSVPRKPHSNFWSDLRTLGLVDANRDTLSEFGRITFEYFNKEPDDFKREHFILSNIRRKSFNIPSKVHQDYLKKLSNLYKYLKIIPPLNTTTNFLLKNERKLFFTECLNTFPTALKGYFLLLHNKQEALDKLTEPELRALFDRRKPNEQNLAKVAIRFQNRSRAFDRRTNFIKSAILSEYEEKIEKSHSGKISIKELPRFSKILDPVLLEQITKSSSEFQVITPTPTTKIAVSINKEIDKISKARTDKQISSSLKNYTKEQLDTLLNRIGENVLNTPRKRVRGLVSRIKRNHTIPKLLKKKYDYKCQICGMTIPKKNGGYYIEDNHIIPLGKRGKDIPDNMIIVCPNHHKMMDYGDLRMVSTSKEVFVFILNDKKYEIKR